MSDHREEPSSAALLAALVTGQGAHGYVGASVQRSHRFPVGSFLQIENLAQMGGVSVSMMINELIECGLEAVKAKLPPEAVQRVTAIAPGQLDRPMVKINQVSKSLKSSSAAKKAKGA
jgi:hypothetical protein